jgi:hypothetical protein
MHKTFIVSNFFSFLYLELDEYLFKFNPSTNYLPPDSIIFYEMSILCY